MLHWALLQRALYGYALLHWAWFGYALLHRALYGYALLHRALFGYALLHQALYGYVLLLWALYGYVLLHWALCSYTMLHEALYGYDAPLHWALFGYALSTALGTVWLYTVALSTVWLCTVAQSTAWFYTVALSTVWLYTGMCPSVTRSRAPDEGGGQWEVGAGLQVPLPGGGCALRPGGHQGTGAAGRRAHPRDWPRAGLVPGQAGQRVPRGHGADRQGRDLIACASGLWIQVLGRPCGIAVEPLWPHLPLLLFSPPPFSLLLPLLLFT